MLQSVSSAQGRYVCPYGTMYSPAGRPLLRCTWDTLYVGSDVLPHSITLFGLRYAAHGTDNAPVPSVQRRAVNHRVVQPLAAAVPDPPTILDEWAALKPRL